MASGRPGSGLRIGELARLAGLTPRAIRYYHATGLLPEPARDAAGYRRYGPADLGAAVRVARLRALKVPIDQVAALTGAAGGDLSTALLALAEDIDRDLSRLASLRDRLRELAASGTVAPGEALAATLREHGLLGAGVQLPGTEASAAALLDVLHPDGIGGVLAQSGPLLADPTVRGRLGDLLHRFQGLPSSGEDPDELADDFASAIPRVQQAAPSASVDPQVMEALLGDRLHPTQLRCMRRLRAILDAHGDEADS